MLSRVVGLVLILAAVPGGCWQQQEVVGTLAVWNRMSGAIEVVAGERRETIQPCATSDWNDFPLQPQFEISSAAGASIATMTGAGSDDRKPPVAFYVVVAGGEVTYSSVDPPADLQPCDQ